jgi:hypothetical protein
MAEEVKSEKPSREVSPRMTSRTFQQFDELRDLQRELNKKHAAPRNNSRLHSMAKGKSKK